MSNNKERKSIVNGTASGSLPAIGGRIVFGLKKIIKKVCALRFSFGVFQGYTMINKMCFFWFLI